jgi:hypothetical protein
MTPMTPEAEDCRYRVEQEFGGVAPISWFHQNWDTTMVNEIGAKLIVIDQGCFVSILEDDPVGREAYLKAVNMKKPTQADAQQTQFDAF